MFASVLALATSASAQSESAGVNQYFTNCASCHESNDPGHQAPKTAVLKQMTPERILEVMTTGSMRNAAAALSDQDKRLIAEWVAGRKIDTDLVGAAEKMPNACASHPQYASRTRRPGTAGASTTGTRDSSRPRRRAVSGTGVAPATEVGLRVSWRNGAVRPDRVRRAAVCDVERRLRLLARRGNRVPALGLPRAVGGPERVHDRPAQQDGPAARHLLRRHSRHGVRALRQHGREIWKTLTDPHPLARITGTPVLFEGRLYVPVASLEEPESGQADYSCCTFRGYMSALDAATGREIWKTYTIPDVPKVVGKNSRGKDMLAPAGAGIWATPTLDVKRRALYITTGNAFAGTPKTANAVMAMNIDTGKVLWSMQALALDTWHNGCVQNIPGGAFPARGGGGGRGGRAGGPAIPYPPENCPAVLGPDWDFAAPAALATTTDGRDILIAPQKQGLVWAINPENGQVIWKQDVAREIAGGRGETLFGGAVDSEKAYFGLISSGHLALDLKTGEEVWYTPLVSPRGARISVLAHRHVRVERVVLEHHRDVAVLRAPISLTTSPPIRSSPSVMSSSPAIIRSAVDLPQPEGPTRITNSPSSISRFMSLTAS